MASIAAAASKTGAKAAAPPRPKRRQLTLAPMGLFYLVVCGIAFAAALIREINVLMVLFSMLCALLALNLRFVLVTLRGLTPWRSAPARVSAGQPFEVDLRLASRQRHGGSWVVTVDDQLQRVAPETGPPLTASVLFNHVAAGQTARTAYRATLSQRGRYRFGRLRVSTRFPLGLVRRSLWFEAADETLVLPRIGNLTRAWHRQQIRSGEGVRQAVHRQGVMQGEFHGLRDWRQGDSRRWIHWRTSARLGALYVRQFEQQEEQDVVLLVDPWLPAEPTAEDRQSVELAISFAATVAADLTRRGGARLTLGVGQLRYPLVRGPVSNPLLNEALETLAVAPATAQHCLPQLVQAAQDDLRRSNHVVLVSTRPIDPESLTARETRRGQPALATQAWRLIDTGSGQLGELFVLDEEPAA